MFDSARPLGLPGVFLCSARLQIVWLAAPPFADMSYLCSGFPINRHPMFIGPFETQYFQFCFSPLEEIHIGEKKNVKTTMQGKINYRFLSKWKQVNCMAPMNDCHDIRSPVEKNGTSRFAQNRAAETNVLRNGEGTVHRKFSPSEHSYSPVGSTHCERRTTRIAPKKNKQ